MVYLPLVVAFSLVAFGYTQDLELQTSTFTSKEPRDSSVEYFKSTTVFGESENKYESSIHKALAWLITQRESDYGWRNYTANVLTALQLIPEEEAGDLLPNQYEIQLSAKQMEIEIVILLWRHHEVPITPPQLSHYCLALSAMCMDPREFHGHDLIGTLQHHEAQGDRDFAYSTLAACTARAHVHKKQIRRLLDIANTSKDHNIDTVAVVIMALRCIVKDHRHRNLQHSLRRPSLSLAKQQHHDGGFGSVRSTALVLQALQDLAEASSQWNKTAARAYLETNQDPDGAFTDPVLTADVLLALAASTSGGGLTSLRSKDCGRKGEHDLDNHVEIDGLAKSLAFHGNDSEIRNVSVTYTLWVGSNITENYTISVTAPRNTSFYNIMQIAMDSDSHFKFEASEWPNGHYVHTLAGYKEEPMGYHYWLLYRLPEIPDPSAPPANQLVAPVGVDDLLIEEGDHYLFWYKKL